jgi:prolipoprotein diacylglyceryltransferase
MVIIRTLFLFLWVPLTLIVSVFSLWRKLRRERVGEEDKIVDTIVASSLIGLLASRVGYILFHFQTFGLDISKWVNVTTFPGSMGVIGLIVTLFCFWKLLGDDWRDTIEIVDYGSITIALYLFLGSLADVILQLFLLGSSTISHAGAAFSLVNIRSLLIPLIYTLFYLFLFIFLNRVERTYRTFMWYRAKRRSAQTGFVVASLCIGYGLIGFLLGWFQPVAVQIAGIAVDPLLKLLVVVLGFVILYLRSGNTLFSRS